MSPALKACPFCGGEAALERGWARVRCGECGALSAARGNIPEIERAWNTRAERDAEVERLREALTFYRDAWEQDCDAQQIGPGAWEGGMGDPEPSQALLADKGDRARAALTPEADHDR